MLLLKVKASELLTSSSVVVRLINPTVLLNNVLLLNSSLATAHL